MRQVKKYIIWEQFVRFKYTLGTDQMFVKIAFLNWRLGGLDFLK